jgi:alpha-mannosidase
MKEYASYTVHMIGHGHIDPTWLWRWQEGYEEVRATFRSALDRIEEYPDFIFTASSACFYQWIKECDAAMFEEIRAAVKAGRWLPAGGFWVEPDCNIPAGESFVRHGLYSQRFFEAEFGVCAKTGFNPDSFGHAGTLPQILRKLGMEQYVFMRPSPPLETDFPGGATFWWEAKDGSRVLAANIPGCYSADAEEIPMRLCQIADSPYLNRGQKTLLGFYGVGNHGGGPTKAAIEAIQEADKNPALPATVLSSMEAFFEAFLAETDQNAIPVRRCDLQHHARGCYSVHTEIKRLNRRVEHALMSAERLAALQWLQNGNLYPAEALREAWQHLLYNQFHDILAGTSLESSYEDSRDQLGAARHCADRILNRVVQTTARDIDTSAEGNTVVVFNPLPWPVRQPVTVNPIITRLLEKPACFRDPENNLTPAQKVRHERVDDRRYAFLAEVPALGYACWHAQSGGNAGKSLQTDFMRNTPALSAGRDFLENAWWRIEFDPYTGEISRLFDRQHQVETLDAGAVLAVMTDASDTWGHALRGFRYEAGRFENARMHIVESGDVLATLQIRNAFGASDCVQEITIYRDTEIIDCRFRVNWQEAYQALKIGFETRIENGEAAFDTAYGCEARPVNGDEEPGQQWIDLTGTIDGKPYGFAILNDGQYGFDVHDGCLRVTPLRSPAYAHHDDACFDTRNNWPIIDQGWHRIHLRLVPHPGPWQDARIPQKAWELNALPVVHIESAHPGVLPPVMEALRCDAENVLLSVVKQSEDGEALVIRGYETAGREVTAALYIAALDQNFALCFAPHEIKTLRIDPETRTLRETDLLEN